MFSQGGKEVWEVMLLPYWIPLMFLPSSLFNPPFFVGNDTAG